MTERTTAVPRLALGLGYAGLLPQAAAVLGIVAGTPFWRLAAAVAAILYAALILSFLGGIWWGLAAAREDRPAWLWAAAVVPSLLALAAALPVAFDLGGIARALIALGVLLAATLAVDQGLHARRIAPAWWLRLRLPLSLGLGVLTAAAGLFWTGIGG